MGTYDEYEGIQLKIGDIGMQSYKAGDDVPIPDNVYIGYEGVVVIKDGKLLGTYSSVVDKWGNRISCKDIISSNNPISEVLKRAQRLKEGALKKRR